MSGRVFKARHAMGPIVRGPALVARDGFSARYDLDRVRGIFSRPDHKLAGESYVGRVLVLDAAKGGVATAWMLHEMKSRGIVPLALVLNSVNPILAQGAGGGTRIGESLQTFNRWHAARVIHSRTCVMIVSDGYETGDATLLGREMAALGRRCRRIVWLNPMMAWEGYAPEARGIKAALPHVDLYAPANTLKSLAALEPYLARL